MGGVLVEMIRISAKVGHGQAPLLLVSKRLCPGSLCKGHECLMVDVVPINLLGGFVNKAPKAVDKAIESIALFAALGVFAWSAWVHRLQ